MNVERILQLADVIEKLPHEKNNGEMYDQEAFSMRGYYSDVKGVRRARCIAGWTVYLFDNGDMCTSLYRASTLLDLDMRTASCLFFVRNEYEDRKRAHDWKDVTPEMAVKTLRNLAETGKVVWEL